MEWISVSTAKYDTFISYRREDKLEADKLAGRLRAAGLTVWLDTHNLVLSKLFPSQIEKGLEESASCCILVGRGGLTWWQDMERQGRRNPQRKLWLQLPCDRGHTTEGRP